MLPKKYIFVDIIWCSFLFAMIYGVYAIRNNTPEHNGKWNSSKTSLEKYVNGAWSFFQGTQAFSGNALHLDGWGGFQELTTKSAFSTSEIRFRFKLLQNAYIYAEFGRNDDVFNAFRLSNNPLFSSAAVRAETNGNFISKTVFNTAFISDRWYDAKIQINLRTKQATIYIDEIKKYSMGNASAKGQIGFRGGLKPSSVTNVIALDSAGKTIFKENFSYWKTEYVIRKIVSALVFLTTWELIRNMYRKRFRLRFPLLSTVQAVSLLITISIFILDYYSIDKYPRIDGILSFYWSAKEDDWKANEINSVNNTLSKIPPKKSYRVLFLGSSQTWGAGANAERETFVAQSEKMINEHQLARSGSTRNNILGLSVTDSDPGFPNKMEFVNAGISGVDSTDLLHLYKTIWKDGLKPDLVVLNLSNNDSGKPDQFRKNLREFATLNQPGIGTMFVLEANTIEKQPGETQSYDIMKHIGKEYNIPVVDLQNHLKTNYDTGILWWDHVHMTSYGQKLAAQLLSEHISAYIASDLAAN